MRDGRRQQARRAPAGYWRLALVVVAVLVIAVSLFTISYVERNYAAVYTGVPERPGRVAIVALDPQGTPPCSPVLPGLGRWSEAAGRLGLELEIAPDPARLQPERYAALVLADPAPGSAWEPARVEAWLASGVGLVFTVSPGLQAPGEGAPESPLAPRLFPGEHFQTVGAGPFALRVGARGPLVAGLDPGTRIEAAPGPTALALQAPASLSWVSPAGAGSPAHGALLHGQSDGVPFIWMSFTAAEITDPESAVSLLANVLAYAARRPIAELRSWPNGAKAAALVAAEIGEDLDSVEDAARMLARRRAPVVFLLPPARAEAQAPLARELGRVGELASPAARGDASPLPTRGERRRLEQASGRAVSGYWERADGLEEGMSRHLVRAGYRYAVAAGMERAVPAALALDAGDLVILPRAPQEGIPGRPRSAVRDPQLLLGLLLAEFAAIEELEGLYALVVPAAWIDQAERVQVLGQLVDELRSRNVWIARGDELARWWSRRARIEVAVERLQAGLAELTLRNRGDERVEGVTTRVYLPPGARAPREVSTQALRPRPTLRVASDRTWIDLITPAVAAGDSVTYAFRY